jgi:hypothetical protein
VVRSTTACCRPWSRGHAPRYCCWALRRTQKRARRRDFHARGRPSTRTTTSAVDVRPRAATGAGETAWASSLSSSPTTATPSAHMQGTSPPPPSKVTVFLHCSAVCSSLN